MYSGITGQEFAADIYIGVVYYQRLRHMVSDKHQVRTIGSVDPVTRQPVKVILFFSINVNDYFLILFFLRVANGEEEFGLERWNGML